MLSYKPFTVALQALVIEKLHSDGLSPKPSPKVLIDIALMNSAESPFSQQEIAGEILSNGT